MKIVFFIAGIFFFSFTYCQENSLFSHAIQQYIQKKKEERLTGLFKSQRPEINIADYWLLPPNETFLLLTFIQPQNDYMRSPEIATDWIAIIEGGDMKIARKQHSMDEWEIKPLTQQRFKELQDFLKGSKPNYRSYFN